MCLRLIVLLLIRKSISSLRRHIERVTERLVPGDSGDEECGLSSAPHSPGIAHKDTTLESMVCAQV